MKLALIGASGFVGSAILKEVIERGHLVTALARHPEAIRQHPLVTAQKVSALVVDEVAEAIKGHDVVISAYNAGWSNPNLYPEFLAGSIAIQQAVKKAGLKRLLVVGGAGSLYVADGVQLVDTPEFPAEWKPGALAARDYLNILKEERDLDWTFLSPAIEMNPGSSGVKQGQYRTGLDSPVFNKEGRSIISVEDLAVAIADEIEQPKHIRQRFTVAY